MIYRQKSGESEINVKEKEDEAKNEVHDKQVEDDNTDEEGMKT